MLRFALVVFSFAVLTLAPASASLAEVPVPVQSAVETLAPAAAGSGAQSPTATVARRRAGSSMIKRINRVRRRHGLRRLRTSRALASSASSYARWMMRRNYFGHVSRIRASSRFHNRGEVLSLHSGYRRAPGRVVRRWLASPGHRALLLSRTPNFAGAGSYRGRYGSTPATIWVVQFGRR